MMTLTEGTNPVYYHQNFLKSDFPKQLSETYIIEELHNTKYLHKNLLASCQIWHANRLL